MHRQVLTGVVPILFAAVPAAAQAATAVVTKAAAPHSIISIDPVAGTTTEVVYDASLGDTRGLIHTPDGNVIVNAWTLNGLSLYDFNAGTWTNLINDGSNATMGAPYQMAWNNNAIGGLGLAGPDGNTVALNTRNLWQVDDVLGATPTLSEAGQFSSARVPMSDFVNNPHDGNEFVGVGYPGDVSVAGYSLQPSLTPFTPRFISHLPHGCWYDSFIGEDGRLYCWGSGPAFTGFQVVDLKTGQMTLHAVTGITRVSSDFAACWADPPERAGHKAWIIYNGDDMLYEVDLTQNPSPATAVTLTPPLPALANTPTARSVEESQLTTYMTGNNATERRFHLDFGAANANKLFVLFPSARGIGGPLTFGGQEIWIVPDNLSIMAIGNALPGAIGKTVTVLDANGRADVDFDLGVSLGVNLTWAAAVMNGGNLDDVSNFVTVTL